MDNADFLLFDFLFPFSYIFTLISFLFFHTDSCLEALREGIWLWLGVSVGLSFFPRGNNTEPMFFNGTV